MNNDETMTGILWRRLRYMLTPQFDLYQSISKVLTGKLVLEVGFGTGFGTVQLASTAKSILAIEPDPEAVKFAKMVLPLHNVNWAQHDITKPFNHINGPTFEVAVMVETLEHIEKWELALTNIYHNLIPNGVLYMTARNRNADLRRNDLHEREWTAEELNSNLSKFFRSVALYDFTLNNIKGINTTVTPLIAVARK